MSTKRRVGVALLAVVMVGGLVEGCVSNYHPEYHPESHFRYVQNVAYSTTIVDDHVAPASPQRAPEPAPPGRARSAPAAASAEPVVVASAHVDPNDSPSDTGRQGVAAPRGAAVRPTGSQLDEQLAASCLAGDAEACKRLAALHVGHRKPGAGMAAPSGYAFDRTVRAVGFRQSVALVAGSNGGTPGEGPRIPLEQE